MREMLKKRTKSAIPQTQSSIRTDDEEPLPPSASVFNTSSVCSPTASPASSPVPARRQVRIADEESQIPSLGEVSSGGSSGSLSVPSSVAVAAPRPAAPPSKLTLPSLRVIMEVVENLRVRLQMCARRRGCCSQFSPQTDVYNLTNRVCTLESELAVERQLRSVGETLPTHACTLTSPFAGSP
jgi:hypothetical protein